jgi:hypothetical protein
MSKGVELDGPIKDEILQRLGYSDFGRANNDATVVYGTYKGVPWIQASCDRRFVSTSRLPNGDITVHTTSYGMVFQERIARNGDEISATVDGKPVKPSEPSRNACKQVHGAFLLLKLG